MIINYYQWIPPPPPEKVREAEEQITIDLGDEYEQALGTATQEEIIDLAGKNLAILSCGLKHTCCFCFVDIKKTSSTSFSSISLSFNCS